MTNALPAIAMLPEIAILGAGSMGGAIAHGIVASGRAPQVTATNRSAARNDALQGVRTIALEEVPDGNLRAVADAGVVVIGVKPAMVPDLLREIAGALRPGTIVVSIAAGIPLAAFESILPAGTPVLRAMPNTPALIGKAVTGLSRGSAVGDEDAAVVREVFATCGTVVEVPEEQIDALSTISGSGPAYVYLLIEKLTAAARGKGFDEDQARLMAEQTFIGATALLDHSGEDPAELRRRVTSPKGTTERAVAVLQEAHLEQVFAAATDAALARAREMAAGA